MYTLGFEILKVPRHTFTLLKLDKVCSLWFLQQHAKGAPVIDHEPMHDTRKGFTSRSSLHALYIANSCNIAPGELKSAQARNLRTKSTSVFIGKLTRIDCGLQ